MYKTLAVGLNIIAIDERLRQSPNLFFTQNTTYERFINHSIAFLLNWSAHASKTTIRWRVERIAIQNDLFPTMTFCNLAINSDMLYQLWNYSFQTQYKFSSKWACSWLKLDQYNSSCEKWIPHARQNLSEAFL